MYGNTLHNFSKFSEAQVQVYLKHVANMIRKLYLKSNWLNWVAVTEQEKEKDRDAQWNKEKIEGEKLCKKNMKSWKVREDNRDSS